jgi:hypothetical protein
LINPGVKIGFLSVSLALAGLWGVVSACSAGTEPEPVALPPELHADYLVFAQRCSKCHSLARPLNSGIDSDEYWKLYVERMRRQPASGISVADTVPILRFLHAYSLEQRRKKELSLGEQAAPPAPTNSIAPSSDVPDAGTPPVNGQR